MAQDPGRGVLVLVLGILSVVFCSCGWILGPIALIMGKNDLKKIDAGEIDPQAKQLTQIGYYLGIAGSVLGGLALIGFCIWGILVAIAAMGASKTTIKTALDVYDAVATLVN